MKAYRDLIMDKLLKKCEWTHFYWIIVGIIFIGNTQRKNLITIQKYCFKYFILKVNCYGFTKKHKLKPFFTFAFEILATSNNHLVKKKTYKCSNYTHLVEFNQKTVGKNWKMLLTTSFQLYFTHNKFACFFF